MSNWLLLSVLLLIALIDSVVHEPNVVYIAQFFVSITREYINDGGFCGR